MNDLQQIKYYINNDIIIKRLSNLIIKIDNILKNNKKNIQLIINYITYR